MSTGTGHGNMVRLEVKGPVLADLVVTRPLALDDGFCFGRDMSLKIVDVFDNNHRYVVNVAYFDIAGFILTANQRKSQDSFGLA
jgi:hypothetical protein